MRYQIRHARVQFGGDVILRDINFEVHDREKIAIVGRNGCGKTTLLKLLMKLYKPTLGTILINGQDIEEIDTAGLRKRISAIFQRFY